jgi:hypothetical protein
VVRTTAAVTEPKPPATGYAHPRCYARTLNDCDAKVSKEHYFSKTVMRAFAETDGSKTVRVLQEGRPDRELPPDQLMQSKVLCRRHNSCLSDLDTTGERVFRACREGLKLIPAYRYFSVPGVDFERWILKAACGLRAVASDDVPRSWLRVLFGYDDLPTPQGLHMHAPLGRTATTARGMTFGVYKGQHGQSGAEVVFDGLRFTLDLRGEGRIHRDGDAGAVDICRPSGIWFDHASGTTFHLGFEWGHHISAVESIVYGVDLGHPA